MERDIPIRVKKTTHTKLSKRKLVVRESFDSVIVRLLGVEIKNE